MNISAASLKAAAVLSPSRGRINRDDPSVRGLVNEFQDLTTREREALAQELGELASILRMGSLFQPRLFGTPFRIRVSSNADAHEVVQALFKMGCGMFNGRYPLVQEVQIGPGKVIGVAVSVNGGIGFWMEGEDENFDASTLLWNVGAQEVIQAQDLAALLARVPELASQACTALS